MTETQLRNHFVDTLRGWIGRKESDGSHKLIVDTYNSLRPLPRNYAVTYADAWCAATVSAAAIEAGLTNVVPRECSCTRMIERFKEMGRWTERDDYAPLPGDVLFYDWNDSGKGDCVGNPEHVGVVEKVADGTITVIEGNYHDAVGRRNVKVNGKFIRGYGLPDYASVSDSPPPPSANVAPPSDVPPPPATAVAPSDVTPPPSASVAPPVTIAAPLTNGGRVRAMDNAELAAFLTNPPPLAVGRTWREWLDADAT